MKLTALRVALLLGALVAALHAAGVIANPYGTGGLLDRLELRLLDARMRARPHGSDVVIVEADERSIQAYGRFPWKRMRFAQLVEALGGHYGAKVIAFDAVFADPDEDESFSALRQALAGLTGSGLLAEGVLWQGLAGDLQRLEQRLRQELVPRRAPPLPVARQCQRDAPAGGAGSLALLACLRAQLESGRVAARDLRGALARELSTASPDEAFAAALRAHADQVVMGYILLRREDELVGLDLQVLGPGLAAVSASAVPDLYRRRGVPGGYVLEPANVALGLLETRESVAVRAPLPILTEALKHFAYFNVVPDPDGTLRRIDLFERVGGVLVPSLVLKSTALYLGQEIQPVVGLVRDTSIDGVEFGPERFVPTDTWGRMLISYFGDPMASIPRYSVVDVVERRVPREALAGKLTIFGTTALGTFDQRVSPFGEFTPGVAINAAAMQNILDRSFLVRNYWMPFFEVLLCLALALLIGLLAGQLRVIAGGALSAGGLAAVLALDYYLIFPAGYWLRLLPLVATGVAAYLGVVVFRYLTEQRAKAALRRAFQFYMTPSVVEQVIKNPGMLKLGGEKRELSVLFSDIRGFTTISESLGPVELVNLLNEYLTPMTDVVFRYDGTLDKYIGDAIMAIFGAPLAQADHARRACHTALDMLVELERLKLRWARAKLPEINIGVGINSGPMSVGNMGSHMRFDYTVMGDNVNLASRLEGITKAYGVQIVVSQATFEAAGATVHGRLLDAVRVKGKAQTVNIYELVGKGAPDERTRAWIEAYQQGLAAYRARSWEEAQRLFTAVGGLKLGDKPAALMLERVAELRVQELPADWDGVYTMTSK